MDLRRAAHRATGRHYLRPTHSHWSAVAGVLVSAAVIATVSVVAIFFDTGAMPPPAARLLGEKPSPVSVSPASGVNIPVGWER